MANEETLLSRAEIQKAERAIKREFKKERKYLGACPFSPYGKTDGFGRTVGGCACGGGIDTYDGDCTCCGSQSCESREDCLKMQKDRIIFDEYIQRKYHGKKD